MLFWAVDNPAPANYLLISGDRDFSNALHQLRMRRYNILLAQPEQASAALVAAAKILWPWTSLISGGLPLSRGDISQFVSAKNKSNPSVFQESVQNPKVQPVNSKPEYCDGKNKPKFVLEGPNQPMTRTSSMPVRILKNKVQLESAPAKQFKKAPHEFFEESEPAHPVVISSLANVKFGNSEQSENRDKSSIIEKQSSQCSQRQTSLATKNFFAPKSCNNAFIPGIKKPETSIFSYSPPKNVLHIGKLSISEYNNYTLNPTISDRNYGGNLIPNHLETLDLAMSHLPTYGAGNLHASRPISCNMLSYKNPPVFEVPSSFSSKNNSTSGMDGVRCYQFPSEFIQGLIGIILIALDSLKEDKLIPTGANIKDCIRYGNPEFQNTDVDMALGFALEQQMLMKKTIGAVELYVGRNEKVWNCINPLGGNPSKYSEATWDEIKKFLTSSAGRSAVMASKCRYVLSAFAFSSLRIVYINIVQFYCYYA